MTVKGESDLFTASMITDWIRCQKVLLPIDHKITISEKRRIAKLKQKEEICIRRLTKDAEIGVF